MASSGVLTIGRPFTSKLVLRTISRPVVSPPPLEQLVESGLPSAVTVCTRAVPSTCVTRGQPGAVLVVHVHDHDHEGKLRPGSSSNHSVAVSSVTAGAKGGRPRHLDHRVDPVADLGVAGIGEDAAIAEGGGPNSILPRQRPCPSAIRRAASAHASAVEANRSSSIRSANADNANSSDPVVVGAEEGDRHPSIAHLAPIGGEGDSSPRAPTVVARRGLHFSSKSPE